LAGTLAAAMEVVVTVEVAAVAAAILEVEVVAWPVVNTVEEVTVAEVKVEASAVAATGSVASEAEVMAVALEGHREVAA